MNQEKYIPTKKDMDEAEANLTPEQKIQSEAHEEGFNLGFEKGKEITILSAKNITSLEKKIVPEKRKYEFTMTLGNKILSPVVDFIRKEGVNNGVNIKIAHIPSPLETEVKVYFEGSPEAIKKTLTNIVSMFKSYGANTQGFLDMFKL